MLTFIASISTAMREAQKILFITLIFCPFLALGQLGGESTYQFLNLPLSARTSALGGKIATSNEADLSLVFSNPSLLDSTMDNHIDLSYINYISDINYASAIFAHRYNKIGTVAIGLQQLGYGNFDRASTSGVIEGSFRCNETCLSALYSYPIDSSFTVGATLKLINSSLDSYWSFGAAADIGATYRSNDGLFSAGLILRNIGFMLKTYTSGNQEKLPFEIVAGISKKLDHAPFRFMITLHQLQNMNMRYKNEDETVSAFDETTENSETTLQKIGKEAISHIILGVEFLPTSTFYVRLGYNYQRRNELKIQEKASVVGFSIGIGVKISKFNLSYSCASYHLAGISNHFSIATDLNQFFRKL